MQTATARYRKWNSAYTTSASIKVDCDDATFDAAWKRIDANSDGRLSVNELCDYFGVPRAEAQAKMKAQKSMSDEQVLEALQLQSLLTEARLKEQQQQQAHEARLRNLAALAAEIEDEDEGEEIEATKVSTLTPTATKKKATGASPLTFEELIRNSK
jgi:hypothetical protein